jgi:hypothetical protein
VDDVLTSPRFKNLRTISQDFGFGHLISTLILQTKFSIQVNNAIMAALKTRKVAETVAPLTIKFLNIF